MMDREQSLDTDYLKRHCPIAWNTPERQDTYSRLGFDAVGEAFRLIKGALGSDEMPPGELPVAIELNFAVQATNGPPVVRVAKKQDTDITADPNATPCGPSTDKPALSKGYLDDHMPIAWDHDSSRLAYATLGYVIERQAIHTLIVKPVESREAIVPLRITVDSTWTAGGCVVICSGTICQHHPHHR